MNSDQNLQNNPHLRPTGNPEPFASSIDPLQSADVQTDMREEVLQLLEERVVVDRSKRKVGEVIVRKEVETYMVQVPVRRERLIVEQVGAQNKQLASIDLSQGEISGVELSNGEVSNGSIGNLTSQPASSMVTVSFSSIEAAHRALAELAAQTSHDQPTRIDISLPSSDAFRYQNWISRSRQ
ncbi:DUF2382 domain-containing protein [Microcoleus sp. FACHB-1515]|uniref:YsnF/AvaK domain-containing protein n=1 Tax=Cyanophyceae TaxID=3028117 RepID=UPI00168A0F3D|nr:DUF2382 domain-containing protein [Microcoleus sp. FACHB-1515]MBD2090811.1 DUF2382 domain-containing protein [Microcoleus sp. FACHB-1515]